jgi:hypothetical protein
MSHQVESKDALCVRGGRRTRRGRTHEAPIVAFANLVTILWVFVTFGDSGSRGSVLKVEMATFIPSDQKHIG